MKIFGSKSKNILSLSLIILLLVGVTVGVNLAGRSQETRRQAAGTSVALSLLPSSETFSANETKVLNLMVTFSGGSASEKVDYFKTQIDFDTNLFQIPAGKYIDTSSSGFDKIFRVDGPQAANDSGKIIIELGALSPGAGPSTDKAVTIAKITFQAKAVGNSNSIRINNQVTEIVNNSLYLIPLSTNTAIPTPTPTSYAPMYTTNTISDNFGGASLNTDTWSSWLSPETATGSVKVENGVLRSNISAVQNFYRAAVADFKNKITGDFEAIVDLKIELGGDPYGSDTGLVFHDDSWDNQITMYLRKDTGSVVNLYSNYTINKQHTVVVKQTINGNSVTVKMQRVGSTAKYYYKDANGQFVFLGSQNNVFSGDGRLALHLNSWEPNYPTVLSTFDNFSAKVNFLSAPPAECLALPQSDDFNGATISAQLWNQWVSNGSVSQGGGTLQTSVPGGNGFAGLITKGVVCGDFDVRVDFSGFTTSGQSEAAARLSIEEDVGMLTVVPSTVFIERFSQAGSSGFRAIKVMSGGLETQFGSPVTGISATTGKLRIRRVGATYTLYYDAGDGWQSFTPANAFSGNAKIAILVKSWNQNPSVSANFDNFNLTNAILDPSITPVPSLTPTPTLSPTPTPPSGREKYTIDVGDKQSLIINLGPSVNPLVKFKAKLASLRSFPELYLKLRVKDELGFLSGQSGQSAAAVGDTCNNPTAPDRDFLIPMKATDGVYSPVQQISQPPPAGATVAAVAPDGWVVLDGVIPGRYYSLLLKGPKTRKGKMVEHFLLQPEKGPGQEFDWSGKSLDPGDLPDPNNGGKQDCTINSTDWSLEKARIGANDGDNLAVCDVNYDNICNAGDSVAILNTLSKRPDDDF